jgi:predicted amidohydrolase
MGNRVRVAAVQLAVGVDVDANLGICLRMIDEAARAGAQLVVLPEFCNHLSWYADRAHCESVAVTLDGPFLSAIAARAAARRLFLVVNVTLRRNSGRVSDTSVLYGSRGELLGSADKQVLIGHENDYFERAQRPSPVIETPIGRLGLYACMDGVICETPRALALGGAQILCNSLNSFALDEASLHVPVRAAENRVFVVAANKVGPLVPVETLASVARAIDIPAEFLHGAGESQVVAPDGRVLARAPRTGEHVAVADLDVARADDKRRPDGSDRFGVRRPQLYRALGEAPHSVEHAPGAERLEVALFQPEARGEAAIVEAAHAIHGSSAELVVLPELFCFDDGTFVDPAAAAARSQRAIAALAAACSGGRVVVTSLVGGRAGCWWHEGVLVGARGVVHRQPQLHRWKRHTWATPGERVHVAELPFGRLAIVVGDDAILPETFRLCALAGAELVALPFDEAEPWERPLGLVERAAENRLCLAAASRDGGLIATLEEDFTIMTPWRTRRFDGLLSHPLVMRVDAAPGRLTPGVLHPRRAHNKVVSHRTHLVDGRPWHLVDAITREVSRG